MASISTSGNGIRTIYFVAGDGKRKRLRLGKIPDREAVKIKIKVESLNAAVIGGFPLDNETIHWLGTIGSKLHNRLVVVGLVPTREPAEPRKQTFLGDWLATYIAGRTDVKPNTRRNLQAAEARLVEYFGKDKDIAEITAGDVDGWIVWLKNRYASGTSGRTVRRAKQFFRAAVRRKLIPENPFADAKAPSQVNEARKFFVSLETAYKVLDACPDAEWRLLFALSRFGGLRCPSEHFSLKWSDLDWDKGRFRVNSPKTEHLEAGGVRWVPIFPELRPYLEEVFDLAPEGTVYVINRDRDAGTNLRTQLMRIIRNAGLEPWPKLFHNLRASRETELAKIYPIHVVCAWIGNTAQIAAKHYLQVTDEDYKKAVRKAVQDPVQTVQKVVQQASARFGSPSQNLTEYPQSQDRVPVGATAREMMQENPVPPTGLEPVSSG
jgi:integrase